MDLVTTINLPWSWHMLRRDAGFPLRHQVEQRRVVDACLRRQSLPGNRLSRLPLASLPVGPTYRFLIPLIHLDASGSDHTLECLLMRYHIEQSARIVFKTLPL